jgi:monoamine oxidase
VRGNIAIWRALEQARRANLADDGMAAPVSGPDGLTRRNVLTALAATGIAASLPRALHAAPGDAPVVIIGGGIAGLTALWHLTQAGIDARLYETRTRIGGRMFTARTKGLPAFEMGGQLVNTDHADMHALVREFGLSLVDRKGAYHRTMILDGHAEVPEGELVAGLRGIAGQIDADSVRLDQNYARVAAELDQMSFTSYLDKHAALMPKPWVRHLMEATARTEYGCEPRQASAIELVFNLPAIDGRRIDVLSRSDERYLIEGGSSALAEAMAARLQDRITLYRRATRIDPLGAGARVFFSDGSKVDASAVIITTPASITRNIDFRVPLPPLWRAFIAEVGLGLNGKVQSAMVNRPWEKPIGRGGEAWQTDPSHNLSQGWDGSIAPLGGPGGVWTWFLGGTEVPAADQGDPHAVALRFAGLTDGAIKGMSAATGRTVRTNWHKDPMAMGAYVNFRPGQLTKFGSLIWTETDGIASNPPSAGPIHFAGEHLSDAYPGYMNGGAQTGRLAAASVIAARAHARRLS